MKTTVALIIMCICTLICQGQNNLKLSIKKGSDEPNYKTEHNYLLEITNTGSVSTDATISIANKECSNVKKTDQTELTATVLDQNKQGRIQKITVPAGRTTEFYVKLSRPLGAKQNSWNCTEIVAKSNSGQIISNSVTIESLIPNPNNNN